MNHVEVKFHIGGTESQRPFKRESSMISLVVDFDNNIFCPLGLLQYQATYGKYYTTNIYGQKSVDVIKAHDRARGPLFLYVPFTAGRAPMQALADDFDACYNTVSVCINNEWGYGRRSSVRWSER